LSVSWAVWRLDWKLTADHDCQHDAQLDFYGKRLATASSDRTVKVFDVQGEGNYTLLDTLRG
jgi:protein transport protein SEC13